MNNPAAESTIHTIGLDIAKTNFSLHGFDEVGNTVFAKGLRRGEVLSFFEKLKPCRVGLEANASAHHWARELAKQGPEVRLIPAQRVKAFLPLMKNDAQDPAMKFNSVAGSLIAGLLRSAIIKVCFQAADWNSKFRCLLAAAITLNFSTVSCRWTVPTRRLLLDRKFRWLQAPDLYCRQGYAEMRHPSRTHEFSCLVAGA